ncbi:hypothetical protein BOTBODRAFT_173727 [Botryobasidium botryosum FD-172 SS1]|uniref:EKC/KEOPS complex subunit GON7 n=1 Tax=Botryobasidium botryosum (strain FD-172 SS1) TaxID=930990 RepID=A0A067MVP1_BOTB1|nr:hypothetical protein BOTBODRAFT_173727 [Botryobasidium botryosum FD-172 SS1]
MLPPNSQPAITISYAYNLPAGITPPKSGDKDLPSSGTNTFPIPVAPSESGASAVTSTAYYAAALEAVRESRRQMGEEMTAWRDAVGDKEKNKEKEAASAKAAEEDEEDENDEVDDEEA